MAGYLDHYGAGEEKRETILKRIAVTLVLVVVFGGLFYYLFKNFSQERSVKQFLARLRNKDYPGAYQSWGCSVAQPCPGYPYNKFMEDWGPPSTADGTLRITDSESCNQGVIVTVDVKPGRTEALWIEKKSPTVGFSPFPSCPNKSPFANMIHQTLGKLRKPFLN